MSKFTIGEVEALTRAAAVEIERLGSILQTAKLDEQTLETAVKSLALAVGILQTHWGLLQIALDDGRDY